MHRLILRARPDVKAVFHAHPTYASAFTAISRDGKPVINTRLLAESYFILEDPVFVEYRLMGTDDLARLTAEKAKNHDVLLLENHGVVCLGKSMLEGFDKIEAAGAGRPDDPRDGSDAGSGLHGFLIDRGANEAVDGDEGQGMKIQLETIPVWDGLNSGSECYICDLMKEAEEDALTFYLGPSVMNPETRSG